MVYQAERSGRHPCPVCHSRRGWPWHFHNCHGPVEDREPAQSYFAGFSLVVCRSSDGRFLMVNEVADNCMGGVPAYWLPAGRVDQGEGFLEAARRETMEEGGVEVEVNGVLRFTLSNLGTNQPCPRLILLAEPIGSQAEAGRAPQPKTVPDWESVGAMWVYPEQLAPLRGLDYRSTDPARYFPAVASGRLAPWPVQTDSFRRLEAVMAQLTRKPGVPRQEQARLFMGAWQGLKAEYPPDMFKEH